MVASARGIKLEFRAQDGAWYDATATFRNSKLRVHFVGFSESEDEVWPASRFRSVKDLQKEIRVASKCLQDEQCSLVNEGMTVCVACKLPDGLMSYYDATLKKVMRMKHGVNKEGEEICSCSFAVMWQNGPYCKKISLVKCGDICLTSLGKIIKDEHVKAFWEVIEDKERGIVRRRTLGRNSMKKKTICLREESILHKRKRQTINTKKASHNIKMDILINEVIGNKQDNDIEGKATIFDEELSKDMKEEIPINQVIGNKQRKADSGCGRKTIPTQTLEDEKMSCLHMVQEVSNFSRTIVKSNRSEFDFGQTMMVWHQCQNIGTYPVEKYQQEIQPKQEGEKDVGFGGDCSGTITSNQGHHATDVCINGCIGLVGCDSRGLELSNYMKIFGKHHLNVVGFGISKYQNSCRHMSQMLLIENMDKNIDLGVAFNILLRVSAGLEFLCVLPTLKSDPSLRVLACYKDGESADATLMNLNENKLCIASRGRTWIISNAKDSLDPICLPFELVMGTESKALVNIKCTEQL